MNIEETISFFHKHNVTNARLLEIIYQTPRELFTYYEYYDLVDYNKAIPIGAGQYTPRPLYIAQMCQAIMGDEIEVNKVLEIGTGCGFTTAILSQIAYEVYSIERIHKLYEYAAENISSLFDDNVSLFYDDGRKGLEEYAPFNGIIVSAYTSKIPDKLLYQLDPNGGVLVYPKGNFFRQRIAVITRNKHHFEEKILSPCRFCKLRKGIN